MSYTPVGPKYPGLYKDDRTGNFYARPHINGNRTWRVLSACSPRLAQRELEKKRSDHALSRNGLATDPYVRKVARSVVEIIEGYRKAGCPKRDGRERVGQSLKEDERHLDALALWWGRKQIESVTLEDCAAYQRWRTPRMTRSTPGNRQVDKELVTLSNVFRWAKRNAKKTGVKYNPIGEDRQRFHHEDKVVHCRDRQPESGDELHAMASELFKARPSEVLGWQLLFEAMVGHRSHEIVRLRMDANEPYQPGYIQNETKPTPALPRQSQIGDAPILFLFDSESHKGTFPYIPIHAALKETLIAFQKWHRWRWPGSPWFFPSPVMKGEHVGPRALTDALRRVTRSLKLPKRTSHGARSYFVNVLRSHGVPDAEIALMIGQTTGGKLIPDVYGKIPTEKLKWMPSKGKPAWTTLLSGMRRGMLRISERPGRTSAKHHRHAANKGEGTGGRRRN